MVSLGQSAWVGQPYFLKIESTNFADTIFVKLQLESMNLTWQQLYNVHDTGLRNKFCGKRNALLGSKLLFDFVFLLCHK